MKLVEPLNHSINISEEDKQLVRELATELDREPSAVRAVTIDGCELDLPDSVVSLLAESVRLMAEGQAVTIVSHQAELSPREAAGILNVSRPYLTRILDQGEIPFHRVGSHRRIKLDDLLAYKEQRDLMRKKGLSELSQMSRRMGIPE